MSVAEALKARWQTLTADLPAEVSDKWWQTLEKEYSDSMRKYHNLKHLSQMFDHFEQSSSELNSPKSVAFAIFFHDLVYNPKESDNEEKSSELFQKFGEAAGIPLDSPLHVEVTDLILLTKTHMTDEHKEEGVIGSEDKHYFLDFDMAVLGSSSEEYEAYTDQIRQEYDFLPNMTYNGLRAKVLRSFLQIPNIFATQEFRSRFEESARRNIQREITELEG